MKPLLKAMFALPLVGVFLCQQGTAFAAGENIDAAGPLSAGGNALQLRMQLVTPDQPATPIVGRITFAGTVTLDATTVNTATTVTSWSGQSTTPTAGLPRVQSRDGDFATFVNVGDGTLFHAPWSFNSGAITNFWSVDGFQFDLSTSSILQQGNGFLVVAGAGAASGNGFAVTPGTWTFTTQDPAASGQFSFSASTAVPESSTVTFLGIGALGIGTAYFFRRKGKPV